jgi:hypothetical protein
MRRMLVALALMLVAGLSAVPSHAMTREAAEESSDGFAEIAGCISGADHLLVSVVVDESASLRETDPEALRVQGITSAIDSLEQLAKLSPDLDVQISLSTFARGYSSLLGWTSLDARTAERFREVATDELPRRDAGDATDYRQALLGAKSDLQKRVREIKDPTACQVVLWFTDGALDVDSQTDGAAREICQPGGIADSVRHAGINVVALALFTEGADVTPAQRDQLKAVAEGNGDTTKCGKTPIAADDAMGVYLPADDPAALQLLFAGAGALVAGGSPGDAASCPSAKCPNGNFELKVDPGIGGARVIVQGGGSIGLLAPNGRKIAVTDGLTRSIGNVHVTALQRESLTTLNLAYSPYSAGESTWVVSTSDTAQLETYWFWGAQLLPGSNEVTAGATNSVAFQLVDQDGQALPKNLYKRVRPAVTVGGEQVASTVDANGVISADYELGVDEVPAEVLASVEVTATTRSSGATLGPISLRERLTVALPPAFPTISPDTVDFGSIEGVGTRTATMDIKGSALGATKVCFTGSTITVPGADGASEGLVTANQECVDVPAEGLEELTLTLEPGATADGLASGDLTFDLQSADGEHLELALETSLEMTRQVDEGQRWALVFALLLLAILIPSLLLVGSNLLLLGKFSMTSGTRIASVPVTVTQTGLVRPNGKPLVEPDDLKNVGFSGTKRGSRLKVEGTGIALRAVRILSLRAPLGIAADPGVRKLVSGTGAKEVRGSATEAPVALGAVDAAFVAVQGAGPETNTAQARLIVVIPAGVDVRGAEDRARRLSTETDWRRILDDLHGDNATRGSSAPLPSRPGAKRSSATAGPTPADSSPDLAPIPGFLGGSTGAAGAPSPPIGEPHKQRPAREQPPNPPNDDQGLPPLPDFLR